MFQTCYNFWLCCLCLCGRVLVVVELVLVGIDCRRRWIGSFGAALDLFFASRFFFPFLKMRMHGVRCVGWFARTYSMPITFNVHFVVLNRHKRYFLTAARRHNPSRSIQLLQTRSGRIDRSLLQYFSSLYQVSGTQEKGNRTQKVKILVPFLQISLKK